MWLLKSYSNIDILSSSHFHQCRFKHFQHKVTYGQYQIIIHISNRQLALEAECSMTIWKVTKCKSKTESLNTNNALTIWK